MRERRPAHVDFVSQTGDIQYKVCNKNLQTYEKRGSWFKKFVFER